MRTLTHLLLAHLMVPKFLSWAYLGRKEKVM